MLVEVEFLVDFISLKLCATTQKSGARIESSDANHCLHKHRIDRTGSKLRSPAQDHNSCTNLRLSQRVVGRRIPWQLPAQRWDLCPMFCIGCSCNKGFPVCPDRTHKFRSRCNAVSDYPTDTYAGIAHRTKNLHKRICQCRRTDHVRNKLVLSSHHQYLHDTESREISRCCVRRGRRDNLLRSQRDKSART